MASNATEAGNSISLYTALRNLRLSEPEKSASGYYEVTKISMLHNLKLFINWKIINRKIYRGINLCCTLLLMCVYRIGWRGTGRLRGGSYFKLNNSSFEELFTFHKCKVYRFELCVVYAIILTTQAFEKRNIYWASVNYNVNLALTLRLPMSYIYGAPILDVSRSHTTTQHSR